MFELTQDQRDLQEGARALARSFDLDYWYEKDQSAEYPWDYVKAFAEGDWLGVSIPEEYGGSGLGVTEASLVLREAAASGAALSGAAALHHYVWPADAVIHYGTEAMKKEMLPKVAKGELLTAVGITEPNAGTDTSRIETRAVQDGDKWVINGQKVWLSQGMNAQKVILLVRTEKRDPEKPFKGMTLFCTDFDREAIKVQKIEKLGRACIDSTEAFISDLVCSDDDIVGEPGNGFYHVLTGLNAERCVIALEAVGIGMAALDMAVNYAQERVVFDRQIGSNQAVAHPLADSYAKLQAAELLTLKAAWLHDNGKPCGNEATTAKYLAAEASFDACDRALQTHGGFGYAKEFHIERIWREGRLYKIAPISQEFALNHIATKILGLPRSF